MSDVRRHPTALADATKAYAEATNSSARFLITESDRMAKELQMAKQGVEQVTTSTRAELRRVILDEVQPLETFMRKMYFKFVIVHKLVVHLNGWK